MELAVPIMLGLSLAACAGLRSWVPLLAVGLLVWALWVVRRFLRAGGDLVARPRGAPP